MAAEAPLFQDMTNIVGSQFDEPQAFVDLLLGAGACRECLNPKSGVDTKYGGYQNLNTDLNIGEVYRCPNKRVYVHSDLNCKCCQSCCPCLDSCCGCCNKCGSCCDFCVKCQTCDVNCCAQCPECCINCDKSCRLKCGSCCDFCIKCKTCDCSCCDTCPACCLNCKNSCEPKCRACCAKCGSCKLCCMKCKGCCLSCASCDCCTCGPCGQECNCKPVGCELCPGPLSGLCGNWHASTDFCPEKCPAICFPCCTVGGQGFCPCPGGKDEFMYADNKFELKKADEEKRYNITHTVTCIKGCCPPLPIPDELLTMCDKLCAEDDDSAPAGGDDAPATEKIDDDQA